MPAMQYVMYATIVSILWFGGNLIFIGGMQVGERHRILKLCASGPQFPDDDLQCLHDGDPVHGLWKTYSGSPG